LFVEFTANTTTQHGFCAKSIFSFQLVEDDNELLVVITNEIHS